MVEITAPKDYRAYNLICELTPFTERLSREFKGTACEFCFKRNRNLKTCEACSYVKYCGKKCQKKDWKNHRLECPILDKLSLHLNGVYETDLTRVTGNTILMIKGKDWKTIKINILGNDCSFDDLNASEDRFPPYQHMLYNSRKENIRRYIGDENMPSEEDFKQILGKIHNSVYPTILHELEVTTYRVLFELPLFSTECIPNCHVVTRNNVNIIVVTKDIKKSEKLSLCKIPLFGTFNIPQITSRCNCTDCRLPYGESVLSKIIDEQEALYVITMTQEFLNMWKLFGGVIKMPHAEMEIDDLLDAQEGVLGCTNALRLKLLAVKCFETKCDPTEKRKYLLKLRSGIEAAFGDYHPHLINVYNALSETYFTMGVITLGLLYHQQASLLSDMYS